MSLKNLFLILLLCIIPVGILTLLFSFNSEQKAVNVIQKNVDQTIFEAEETLDVIEEELRTGSAKNSSYKYQYDKYDVFIYERSKLSYWSTNDYSLDPKDIFLQSSINFFIENEFGKFIIIKGSSLQHTIAIAIPLERNYPLKNQFLKQNLNKSIFKNIEGKVLFSKEEKSLKIESNNFTFYFQLEHSNYINESYISLAVMLIFIWLFYCIYFINKNIKSLLFQLLCLISIRIILFFAIIDYEGSIFFSPSVFASSIVQPNLFQLIVNSIILFFIFNILLKSKKNRKNAFSISILYLFIQILVVNDLIKHSSLYLTPFQIVDINVKTIVICIAMVLNVLFASIIINKYWVKYKDLRYGGITVVVLTIVVYFFQPQLLLPSICIVLVILGMSYLIISNDFLLVITLFTFSVFIAYRIASKNEEVVVNQKVKLLNKLINGDDPYTEFLINDVSERISKDKIIISKLKSPFFSSEDFIKSKVQKIYLDKYFSGYDFHIEVISIDQIFRNDKTLRLLDDEYIVEKKEYYTDLYKLINKQVGSNDYLKIVCFDDEHLVKNIAITFRGKSNPKQSVMPQLLLNGATQIENEEQFSYAIIDGNIVSKKGGFLGNMSNNEIKKLYSDDNLKEKDGYNFLHVDIASKKILIAHKVNFQNDLFNTFFLITILLLFVFMLYIVIKNISIKSVISLTERLQITFTIIVLASFVMILSVTVASISKSYKKQILNDNLRIAKNVSWSVSSLLEKQELDKKELENKLELLSNSNDADIHLYNKEGLLISSTLPELFEKKIKSIRIPYEFINNKQQKLIENKVGDFHYNSAIYPVLSNESNVLGYISIPFFDGQEVLEERINELSYLTLKFSLAVLIVLIVAAIYLARRITKPIMVLSTKLGNVNLEKENEIIPWNRKDEIGKLVGSYNEMLLKLAESRDALKKKEQEEAWKQMAKQVAHEIKNPLTPMKLSLQFLQSKIAGKKYKIEDVSSTTETLIKQIDNLSEIVNSFSEFATMPAYTLHEENITDIISDVCKLHGKTAVVHNNIDIDLYVVCDKKAFSGIITNLFINGVQAVSKKEPVISLNVFKNEDKATITITDNGEGIPEEIKDKVFIPNFSTKYTGSGIGLALAKKGIEEFGGKIWFESKLNEGTTFYIELPLSK